MDAHLPNLPVARGQASPKVAPEYCDMAAWRNFMDAHLPNLPVVKGQASPRVALLNIVPW